MSKMVDGWEVVAIEPGLWCLRRPGYSAEIQASADGDNIDIADDAGRRWLYPPIAGIERLLALRRAALAPEDPLAVGVRSLVEGLDAIRAKALAPEAQAPRGEPWRPAVGEECYYYVDREWRLATRMADEGTVQSFRPDPKHFGAYNCGKSYDGIRPLGSLPVPPSCGGEPEARERAERPVVASERPGLVRLLEWARREEIEAGAEMERERVHGDADALSLATGSHQAYADCVREIEREFSALGPPSIAKDLRIPEPGAFEGTEVVGEDDQLEREIEALAREVTREDHNRAVRKALAELRGELNTPRSPSDGAFLGMVLAVQALDRMAERFKP